MLARIAVIGERSAQLRVHRVHPAEILDIYRKRGRRGGIEQGGERRRRLGPQLCVDIEYADARIALEIADIVCEGLAELLVGLDSRLLLAAPGRLQRLLNGSDVVAVRVEPIEARRAQQRNKLLRGIAGRGRKP